MPTNKPCCHYCGSDETSIALAYAFDFVLDGIPFKDLICCDVSETEGL